MMKPIYCKHGLEIGQCYLCHLEYLESSYRFDERNEMQKLSEDKEMSR